MRVICGPGFRELRRWILPAGYCRQNYFKQPEAAARCPGTLFVRRETQGLYARWGTRRDRG